MKGMNVAPCTLFGAGCHIHARPELRPEPRPEPRPELPPELRPELRPRPRPALATARAASLSGHGMVRMGRGGRMRPFTRAPLIRGAGPDDQHPPLVPAELQGRQALP